MIKLPPLQKTNNYYNQINFNLNTCCPNLAPLTKDTVSFKGTNKIEETKSKKRFKKTDFDGIDFAVVERFKPNIQQFKSKEDLQEFAKKEIEKIQEKDFKGRQKETIAQRKAMLKEWFDYVINENDAYSNTQRLIVLNAITKSLKPNTDEIPEVLIKGVLAQTVADLETRLKANPKENFDFNKMYKTNLRAHFAEDTVTGETMTGWIVIPSKQNDPENFESHVEKLKTLSHKNWCTKSFNAEPYLAQGDFHVYLENGEPKLGVRFVNQKVGEIQGAINNGAIPVNYLNIFKAHQQSENFELGLLAEEQVKRAEKALIEVEKVKKTLGTALALKTVDDVEKLLKYFGKKCKKTEKGLIVEYYKQPSVCNFSELGIDEDKIFKHVYKIEKYGNFTFSNVTNLGNLESIGGSTDFSYVQLKSLGKLQDIGGDATFQFSDIEDLGELKRIGGTANFNASSVKDLKNLTTIEGNANFYYSSITNLKNLKSIGGNASFHDSNVVDLGKLEYIGGNVNFKTSKLTNLGSLKTIDGDAIFFESEITDLGDLEKIGKRAIFTLSKIKKLKNLEYIGSDAIFSNSKIDGIGKLKYIGGDVSLKGSKLRRKNFRHVEIHGNIGK